MPTTYTSIQANSPTIKRQNVKLDPPNPSILWNCCKGYLLGIAFCLSFHFFSGSHQDECLSNILLKILVGWTYSTLMKMKAESKLQVFPVTQDYCSHTIFYNFREFDLTQTNKKATRVISVLEKQWISISLSFSSLPPFLFLSLYFYLSHFCLHYCNLILGSKYFGL